MVAFCPFWFRVPLLKLNIRKKGALIIKGLLRNLGFRPWDCKGVGLMLRALGFRVEGLFSV